LKTKKKKKEISGRTLYSDKIDIIKIKYIGIKVFFEFGKNFDKMETIENGVCLNRE
jgi:hypothetical protein